MTVTHTPRRRTRTGAAVVAALLSVILLLPGTAFASSSASAATPSPSPTPSVTTGELDFTLSPLGNGIVRAGESLAISVTASNGTSLTAAAADVSLELGATALADRGALAQWLAGDDLPVQLAPAGATLLEAVPPGERHTAGILIAAEDPLLAGRAPGVYPLRATYQGPAGTLVSTSVVTVPDDAATPAPVGVVVPITAGPLSAGLLTAAQLTTLTAPDGELTALLDAVEGTAAILAIDPAVPAAIRVLGSSAPTPVAAWLARLDSLPNSRFALQFGDADLAAQIQAGFPQPLAPVTLQPYLDADDFTVSTPTATPTTTVEDATLATPAPTASPSPTATPGAPVYPTLAELTDVGATRGGLYWPFTATAGADVVGALGSIVTDDRASVTLIPSATTAEGASGGTVPANARAGDAQALVYDSAVSAALNEASRRDEGVLRGAALTEATAYLAFATRDAAGSALLVTLDRADGRSRIGLTTSIAAALEAPGVQSIGLDVLVDEAANNGTVIDVTVTEIPARETKTTAVTDLTADEQRLTEFATILDDASLLTARERASMLQLLGSGWTADDTAWTNALVTHRAATTATLGAVSIPALSDINLFGASVPLGIWVRNELPWPVNVVLIAIPDDPRLIVQRLTPVIAEPSSNTRVEIPVEARVGSGEVTLEMQLRSPTSIAIGTPQTANVSVRAEWEAIGVVALSVIVGVLLVLGLLRTVLRRRRRRRDAATSNAGEEKHVDSDDEQVPDER